MNVSTPTQTLPMLSTMPIDPSQQAGFLFRSVWLPLIVTFPTGQSKSTFLDMLDKVEPPMIPDGFGIGEEKPAPYKDTTTGVEKQLHTQLVTSSWCGLLAALTPLIDAATDESITENVLKAMQNYAALCGTLDSQCLSLDCTIESNIAVKFSNLPELTIENVSAEDVYFNPPCGL